MDLRGRVALITGAAGHIGGALTDALAELGATIVVLDVSEELCATRAQSIKKNFGVEALPLACDLTDELRVRNVPRAVLDRFRRLDIVVNCAAFVGTSNLKGWVTPFREQCSDTWRLALEVNLTAAFVLVQACEEPLRMSGHGSVVNVSSIYGMAGPDMRLYNRRRWETPPLMRPAKAGCCNSLGGLQRLWRRTSGSMRSRLEAFNGTNQRFFKNAIRCAPP